MRKFLLAFIFCNCYILHTCVHAHTHTYLHANKCTRKQLARRVFLKDSKEMEIPGCEIKAAGCVVLNSQPYDCNQS